jgi:hypothetical protein
MVNLLMKTEENTVENLNKNQRRINGGKRAAAPAGPVAHGTIPPFLKA